MLRREFLKAAVGSVTTSPLLAGAASTPTVPEVVRGPYPSHPALDRLACLLDDVLAACDELDQAAEVAEDRGRMAEDAIGLDRFTLTGIQFMATSAFSFVDSVLIHGPAEGEASRSL